MNINGLGSNALKFLGFFVLVVGCLFVMAKITHQTLVISPTHLYCGNTSEIAPSLD